MSLFDNCLRRHSREAGCLRMLNIDWSLRAKRSNLLVYSGIRDCVASLAMTLFSDNLENGNPVKPVLSISLWIPTFVGMTGNFITGQTQKYPSSKSNRMVSILIILTMTILFCNSTIVNGQDFARCEIADSLGAIETLITSDLDLDGDQDVLFSDYVYVNRARAYRLLWLENDGDGCFSERLITEEAGWIMGITVYDFDLDGDNDILLAGAYDEYSVTILENLGNLEFRYIIIDADLGYAYMPDEVKATDLNGDGMVDLVVSYYFLDGWGDYSGGIAYYIQDQDYSFQVHELTEFGYSGWIDLNLFDYDGNGTPDITAHEFSHRMIEDDMRFGRWMNDGEAHFTYEPLPFIDWGKVKWIDFNQDGLLDFLRYRGSRHNYTILQLFERDDEGEYELHEMRNDLSVTGEDIAIEDFDKDGRWEFILTECSVYYLEYDDNYNIEWSYLTGFIDDPGAIRHIKSVDVNHDGLPDCVFSNNRGNAEYNSSIYLLLNTYGQRVVDENEVLNEWTLLDAYPNPFNSSTIVSFSLIQDSHVSLKVFDFLGREVLTLLDMYNRKGSYRVHLDGSKLPAGTYVVKLKCDDNSSSKIVELIK